MSDIKRYTGYLGGMVNEADGEYIKYTDHLKTISDKDTKIKELECEGKSSLMERIVKKNEMLIEKKKELKARIAELEKGIEEMDGLLFSAIHNAETEKDFNEIENRAKELLSNHPETVDKRPDIVDKKWHEYDDIVDKE